MMAAKIDVYTKWSKVKVIEIEVSIIEKIIPYTVVDSESDLNIMSFQTMKKLELNITSQFLFFIKIANQSPSILIGQMKIIRCGLREKNISWHIMSFECMQQRISFLYY